MHMISAEFKSSGGLRRYDTEIDFYFSAPKIFGVPHYSEILEKLALSRDVRLHPNNNLIKVDKQHRFA